MLNLQGREMLARIPSDIRARCDAFCLVMEYQLDLFVCTPMSDREPPVFMFSLIPKNDNAPMVMDVNCNSEPELAQRLLKELDWLTRQLGETERSIEMKAQIKGLV
jgi:hypothetical protein